MGATGGYQSVTQAFPDDKVQGTQASTGKTRNFPISVLAAAIAAINGSGANILNWDLSPVPGLSLLDFEHSEELEAPNSGVLTGTSMTVPSNADAEVSQIGGAYSEIGGSVSTAPCWLAMKSIAATNGSTIATQMILVPDSNQTFFNPNTGLSMAITIGTRIRLSKKINGSSSTTIADISDSPLQGAQGVFILNYPEAGHISFVSPGEGMMESIVTDFPFTDTMAIRLLTAVVGTAGATTTKLINVLSELDSSVQTILNGISDLTPIPLNAQAPLPVGAKVGDHLNVSNEDGGRFNGIDYDKGDGATVVSLSPARVTPAGATKGMVMKAIGEAGGWPTVTWDVTPIGQLASLVLLPVPPELEVPNSAVISDNNTRVTLTRNNPSDPVIAGGGLFTTIEAGSSPRYGFARLQETMPLRVLFVTEDFSEDRVFKYDGNSLQLDSGGGLVEVIDSDFALLPPLNRVIYIQVNPDMTLSVRTPNTALITLTASISVGMMLVINGWMQDAEVGTFYAELSTSNFDSGLVPEEGAIPFGIIPATPAPVSAKKPALLEVVGTGGFYQGNTYDAAGPNRTALLRADDTVIPLPSEPPSGLAVVNWDVTPVVTNPYLLNDDGTLAVGFGADGGFAAGGPNFNVCTTILQGADVELFGLPATLEAGLALPEKILVYELVLNAPWISGMTGSYSIGGGIAAIDEAGAPIDSMNIRLEIASSSTAIEYGNLDSSVTGNFGFMAAGSGVDSVMGFYFNPTTGQLGLKIDNTDHGYIPGFVMSGAVRLIPWTYLRSRETLVEVVGMPAEVTLRKTREELTLTWNADDTVTIDEGLTPDPVATTRPAMLQVVGHNGFYQGNKYDESGPVRTALLREDGSVIPWSDNTGSKLVPWDLTPIIGPVSMVAPSPFDFGGSFMANSAVVVGDTITVTAGGAGIYYGYSDAGAVPTTGKFSFYWKPSPLPMSPNLISKANNLAIASTADYAGYVIHFDEDGLYYGLTSDSSPDPVDPDYDVSAAPVICVNVDADVNEVILETINGAFGPYPIDTAGKKLFILAYLYASSGGGDPITNQWSATDDFGSGIEPQFDYPPMVGMTEVGIPAAARNGDILYATAPGYHNSAYYGIAANGDPDFAILISKSTGAVMACRQAGAVDETTALVRQLVRPLPVRYGEPTGNTTYIFRPTIERGVVLSTVDVAVETTQSVQITKLSDEVWEPGMRFFVLRLNQDNDLIMNVQVSNLGSSGSDTYADVLPAGEVLWFEYINDQYRWQHMQVKGSGQVLAEAKAYAKSVVGNERLIPKDGLYVTRDGSAIDGRENGLYALKGDFKRKRRVTSAFMHLPINMTVIANSPDGNWLATIDSTGRPTFYNTIRLEHIFTDGDIAYVAGAVQVVFSDDSKLCMFSSTNGVFINLYRLTNGMWEKFTQPFSNYGPLSPETVQKVSFQIGNGSIFIAGSWQGPGTVMGVGSLDIPESFFAEWTDPQLPLSFGIDLFGADADMRLTAWDVDTSTMMLHVAAFNNVTAGTGGRVIIARYDGSFGPVDLATATKTVHDVVFIPGGEVTSGKVLILMENDDDECILKMVYTDGVNVADEITMHSGADNPHTKMWISPDGAYIATNGGAMVDVTDPSNLELLTDHSLTPGYVCWACPTRMLPAV